MGSKIKEKKDGTLTMCAVEKRAKQNKKIEEAKVEVINFEEIKLLDEGYDEMLKTDPKYSLLADPLNIYGLTDEHKKFIEYYCQWKNIPTVCNIMQIDTNTAMQYFKSYATQQEIRRINMAMYSRQFNSKMMGINQLGGYLTSLITDDNVPISDRLSSKEKLSAVKLLIELNELKHDGYENSTVINEIEVDTELEKLSVKSIKQLIENSKDSERDKNKDQIIEELNTDGHLTIEEKTHLKSLSMKELLALQDKINNKGEIL